MNRTKILAAMFAFGAIVMADSSMRAMAQSTAQTQSEADRLAAMSNEVATSELSAARRAGGGGTAHVNKGGGTRHVNKVGGGGKHVNKVGGGGKGKNAAGGGKNKNATGGGKNKNATGGGKGKNAAGPAKVGAGPAKLGAGPGKIGKGLGKIGIGPGKIGKGPGKIAVGVGPGRGAILVRRGGYRLWWGGRWVTFVGIGTLTAILVGSDYYDPYGYVSIARPYCSGLSENGCRLHWQNVALEEGGEQVQCVQYCPRRKTADAAPAAAAAVSLAEEPAQPRGKCEVVVYADPGLKGVSAPTTDDQPTLVEAGWKNEIASVEVKSGTWDFFTDDNYGGTTMRLAPGSYGELNADWVKKIGSFNCVNPAT
jgi:hypothetical protein